MGRKQLHYVSRKVPAYRQTHEMAVFCRHDECIELAQTQRLHELAHGRRRCPEDHIDSLFGYPENSIVAAAKSFQHLTTHQARICLSHVLATRRIPWPGGSLSKGP